VRVEEKLLKKTKEIYLKSLKQLFDTYFEMLPLGKPRGNYYANHLISVSFCL
jgi:hypothetical protein